MAKKKENFQTPEEKLREAIIPEDQQPYKLPENWVWVRLGSITTVVGGGTPSSTNSEYYDNGNIAWITPADLSNSDDVYITSGRKNITKSGLQHSSARIMPKGTVLLSTRAPIGYVAIALNAITTNQGFKNFLPSKRFLPEYLYWYLKGNKALLESKASGTTFLELSGSKAARIEVPLAPLPEQQRIVDRIENLFAKLDSAKELIQSALDSFETRRSAILHKAFTGELTASWRKSHGVSMDSWEEVCFNSVAEIQSNLVDPIKYMDLPHIAPDNIEKRTGKLLDYHTIAEDKVTSGKHMFFSGQILYSKIRPYLSKVVIVDFNGLCSADMYPIKAKGDTKFLWYYMLSNEFLEQVLSMGSRSVLPKINQKELSTLTIKMPSLIEQQVISKILDDIFAKEQSAKELADIIDKIDLIKKSILARAFRGELGTNNKKMIGDKLWQ